jgi:hypothetical protein
MHITHANEEKKRRRDGLFVRFLHKRMSTSDETNRSGPSFLPPPPPPSHRRPRPPFPCYLSPSLALIPSPQIQSNPIQSNQIQKKKYSSQSPIQNWTRPASSSSSASSSSTVTSNGSSSAPSTSSTNCTCFSPQSATRGCQSSPARYIHKPNPILFFFQQSLYLVSS